MSPWLLRLGERSSHPPTFLSPLQLKFPFEATEQSLNTRLPTKHTMYRVTVLTRADGTAKGPYLAKKYFSGPQMPLSLGYFFPSPLPRIRPEPTVWCHG